MTTTGKPAILIIYKNKDDMEGVYLFDSHLDVMDAVERYEQLGYTWQLMGFNHIKEGQLPKGCPPLQKALFED